jgi:hypothetical protein
VLQFSSVVGTGLPGAIDLEGCGARIALLSAGYRMDTTQLRLGCCILKDVVISHFISSHFVPLKVVYLLSIWESTISNATHYPAIDTVR